MAFDLKGRACQLGDGYDEKLDATTPFACQSLNVVKGSLRDKQCTPLDLKDQYLHKQTALVMYLEDSFKRECDFQLRYDQDDYYLIKFNIKTRSTQCDKFDNRPLDCPNYVNKIYYGVELQVIVPKQFFPKTHDEMQKLVDAKLKNVNDTKLTREQETETCFVLINFVEERELSFLGLFTYIMQIQKQESQNEIPICAEYKKVKEMAPMEINNDEDFKTFLTHLYAAYRKIEIKLERAEYPLTFSPGASEKKTFLNIATHLKGAKDEFMKMDKNNVIFMYTVMKKLWTAYVAYLKYMFDNKFNIEEGDDLPGTFEVFLPLLKRLDTWRPVKIGNGWFDSETNLLVIPENLTHVGDTLKNTVKYEDLTVIKDSTVKEPKLHTFQPDFEGPIGFIDMTGAVPQNELAVDMNGLEIFKGICPQSCNDVKKRWICKTCADFVRITNKYPNRLVCNCGSKSSLMECLNSCHEPVKVAIPTGVHMQTQTDEIKVEKSSSLTNGVVDNKKAVIKTDIKPPAVTTVEKPVVTPIPANVPKPAPAPSKTSSTSPRRSSSRDPVLLDDTGRWHDRKGRFCRGPY